MVAVCGFRLEFAFLGSFYPHNHHQPCHSVMSAGITLILQFRRYSRSVKDKYPLGHFPIIIKHIKRRVSKDEEKKDFPGRREKSKDAVAMDSIMRK